MPRKGHKKSRGGCVECKRRHLKCDENRPRCNKCDFSARECVFDSPAPTRARINSLNQVSMSSNDDTLDETTSPHNFTDLAQDNAPSQSTVPSSRPPSYATELNMDYLELFYNFETETCKTVARTEAHVETYRRLILARGFSRPFLMYQVIATSAMHMSLQRPQHATFYKDTATSLQSKALTGFNTILPHIDESNCLDVLLFQHTLALHVFCDIFNSFDEGFNVFLDRLVGCIRLLRGVNVVIQTWWDCLSKTELGIIMTHSDQHFHKPKQSQHECASLKEMIDRADLSASSISVCHAALASLQEYFDSEHAFLEELSVSSNMVFSWLISASSEFTDLLDQRRPEAMVLLAYYAVLLHKRRGSWAIGNAGSRLLEHINGYLGKRWEAWLVWPNSVLLDSM